MKRLESLDAWQVARQVSRAAYRFSNRLPSRGHGEFASQIRRAAISIPANLAEGYGLGTRAQWVRCVRIALGSACELKCHLERARDLQPDCRPPEDLGPQTERTLSFLIGLLKHLGARALH